MIITNRILRTKLLYGGYLLGFMLLVAGLALDIIPALPVLVGLLVALTAYAIVSFCNWLGKTIANWYKPPSATTQQQISFLAKLQAIGCLGPSPFKLSAYFWGADGYGIRAAANAIMAAVEQHHYAAIMLFDRTDQEQKYTKYCNQELPSHITILDLLAKKEQTDWSTQQLTKFLEQTAEPAEFLFIDRGSQVWANWLRPKYTQVTRDADKYTATIHRHSEWGCHTSATKSGLTAAELVPLIFTPLRSY